MISFTVTGSTEEYSAKIYAIEPTVEIATRTLQVRAIAENKEGKLLPVLSPMSNCLEHH
jgi:membrane fusion protein (multidrug efflux system)